MQETVKNSNRRNNLFLTFVEEIFESRKQQINAERQIQEEKYQRRTKNIYDLHERQLRKAAELQQCLGDISQNIQKLELVLRGDGIEGNISLSASLLRPVVTVQRYMAQSLANVSRIRNLLAAPYRLQVDAMVAKMEADLNAWTALVQPMIDDSCKVEMSIDNMLNLIAVQRRSLHEISTSPVMATLCRGPEAAEEAEEEEAAKGVVESVLGSPTTTFARSSVMCSTPIARD